MVLSRIIAIGVALTLFTGQIAAEDLDWESYWYNNALYDRSYPYRDGLGVQVAVLDTGLTDSYECRAPDSTAASSPAAITSVEVYDAAADEVFRAYKAVVYTDPPVADVIEVNYHASIRLFGVTAAGNAEYRFFGVTDDTLRKGASTSNSALIPGTEQMADITPDGRGVIFSLPRNIVELSTLSVAGAAADSAPICNSAPTLRLQANWTSAFSQAAATPLVTHTDTAANVTVCGETGAASAPEADITNVNIFAAPPGAPFADGFVVTFGTDAPPDEPVQNAFNYSAYLNMQRATGRSENWILIYQRGRFVSQVLREDNSPVPEFSHWGTYDNGMFIFNLPGDATSVTARTAITQEEGDTQLCDRTAALELPDNGQGFEIISPDEAANRPQDDFAVPADAASAPAEERLRHYALLCPPFDQLASGDPLWEEIEKAVTAEGRAFNKFMATAGGTYYFDHVTGQFKEGTAAGTNVNIQPQRVRLLDPNAPFDPINNPIVVDRVWPCPQDSSGAGVAATATVPPLDTLPALDAVYGRPSAATTDPPGDSVQCQNPATAAGENPADILGVFVYTVPTAIDPSGSYLVEIQTQQPFNQLMNNYSAAILLQVSTVTGETANRILETHEEQEKIGAVDGSNRVYRGTSGLWSYSNTASAVVRLPGTALSFTVNTFHSDAASQPSKCDTTPVINLPGIFPLMGTAAAESVICPSVLRPELGGGDVADEILDRLWVTIEQFNSPTVLEKRDASASYNQLFNSLYSKAECAGQTG
jgi:hypothetical protein